MTLQNYLYKHYTKATAKSYLREIKLFLAYQKQAEKAIQKDLINYLNEQRKIQKASSINRILQSIKKYYLYLVFIGVREDNPAQYLQIKDYKSKLPITKNRLLSQEEIQGIWQHFIRKNYRYKLLRNRNLAMLSLLLFQALSMGEIIRLSLQDIDLENTQINIPKTNRNNPRLLPLLPSQILPFYTYLFQDRALLLSNKIENKALFISKLGNPEQGDNLHYLLSTARHLYPHKTINPKTVRMSVISHQFEQGKDIQQVQYFAGHRNPSSTERYKTNQLEQLQQGILKHHPLA